MQKINSIDDVIKILRKIVDEAVNNNHPGWLISVVLWIIRLGERGSVARRIKNLPTE